MARWRPRGSRSGARSNGSRRRWCATGWRPAHRAAGPAVAARATAMARAHAFVSKSSQAVDPAVLRRIDTCWSATTGLALVNMIGTASDLSARHLLMALDAGNP